MRHARSRAFSFLLLIVAFSLIYAGILNAAVSNIDAFAKKDSKKSSSSRGDSNGEGDGDRGSSNIDTDNNNSPQVESQTTTRGEGAGEEEQGSESTILPPPPQAVLDANNNNIPIPGAVDPTICTPDLKRFVVHLFNETLNGKPILKIWEPCVTITGTVIGKGESRIPHIHEESGEDSDLIINLLPDPEFKSLESPPNTRFAGAIHLEAICQGNNFDTGTGLVNASSLHIGDCKGYNGPHFPIPNVGDRLKVTGVYVQDIGEGGHTELHPVYKIETIGSGSSNTSLSSLKDQQ
jgi:hypothetical protein